MLASKSTGSFPVRSTLSAGTPREAGLTEIALVDGNLRVSWEPRVPYRPAWAGQTTRYGFCSNVYSDGSGYAWAPLWFLAAVATATAIAMGAGYPGWRRRPRPGFCPRCAYDLRASPDHCPGCGYRPTRSDHKNAEKADRE